MQAPEEIKLYFDFKSPFAFLAKDPAFALSERYRVDVRFIPFTLRIKGRGERSVYSERKVRYSYMDARRHANARETPLTVRGPRKVYDSSPALIGALWTQREGCFRAYADLVFERFFQRALEIDEVEPVALAVAEAGGSADGYRRYVAGEGRAALESCLEEADADEIFGVPIFVFHGELFWGQDRMPLLEARLRARGLAI